MHEELLVSVIYRPDLRSLAPYLQLSSVLAIDFNLHDFSLMFQPHHADNTLLDATWFEGFELRESRSYKTK